VQQKKIRFTYYLKPTSKDRKMEFDPKRNLLNGLEGTNIRMRKYPKLVASAFLVVANVFLSDQFFIF
jgi:hypothetical protein